MGGVMAIQIIQEGRRPPSWKTCLDHSARCGTPSTYTKFGEYTLIGSEDMPPQQNSKKRPLAAEF